MSYIREVKSMKYEELMMNIVRFDSEDVITASGTPLPPTPEEQSQD